LKKKKGKKRCIEPDCGRARAEEKERKHHVIAKRMKHHRTTERVGEKKKERLPANGKKKGGGGISTCLKPGNMGKRGRKAAHSRPL